MSSWILDASALMAALHREPGWEAVAAILSQAQISAVNLSEVGAKLLEKGLPEAQVGADLESLRLGVVPFDRSLAYRAAALRPVTRAEGLSFADRACLATAQALGARAVTADRRWARLRTGVQVEVIR